MVLLPFDHEEAGKLFDECPVFEELRSTLSLGLVWACYGECLLNAVATHFPVDILDGWILVIDGSTARRCIAIVTNERRASYVIPLNSS